MSDSQASSVKSRERPFSSIVRRVWRRSNEITFPSVNISDSQASSVKSSIVRRVRRRSNEITLPSVNMSDSKASGSEASLIQTKRIDGIVEQNEDFKAANDKIWRRKQEPLGKGGYSQVYLYENGGSRWAVKRITNISGGGRTSSAELKNEKAALIKFSDRERFVRFIGWFACENIEYFALEYVQFGNLEENLRKRERTKKKRLKKGKKTEGTVKRADVCLPEAEVRTILTQILEGIEFMHAEGYIHRDLKPENILVAQKGPEWQVKITDLGLSKCTLGLREGYTFTGTPPYMAPEIYNSMLDPSRYTNAIDIWAVGCIACRMLIGEPPFSELWLLVQYLKAIEDSKPLDQLCKEVPYISKDLPGLLDIRTLKGLFVRQLLEPKPGKRLNASHAKGHAWLQGYDFRTLQGHGPDVNQVAFSPNGKLLAWVSRDCTVRLWSVEECKSKHILESPGYCVFITFSRDSTLVVGERCSGLVKVWDTETGNVKHRMEFPLDHRRDKIQGCSLDCLLYCLLDCSPDGSLVAAALENGSIELRDTEKGEIKHVFPCTWKARSRRIKLSSNGEVMAVIHDAGCTIFRDTGKEYQERMCSDDPKSHVVFSPNNQVMALESQEGVFFWNSAWFGDKHGQSWKCISEPPITLESRIVFSPDSKLAVVLIPERYILTLGNGPDFELTLHDTGQGGRRVLKGHSDLVTSVAFSPMSPLLASASRDHTVILWDTEKGEQLCSLIAHSDRVTEVAFSPNGELVATASADGIVRLWNVSRWNNRKDQE
ncbi:kinase-like domain-containing protein [Usnea florida]